MNRNFIRLICLAAIGLSSAAQSMDNLRLDLWKIDPTAIVERESIAAMRDSIGTRALTRFIPVYNQHWAYVAILRERGMIDEANVYRDTTMPRQIRDDALRSTVQQIIARLNELLPKRPFTVFDVMKVWACIALLRENNADEGLINGYRDQLLARLARASLPPEYERMMQQRDLAQAANIAQLMGRVRVPHAPAAPVVAASAPAPAPVAPIAIAHAPVPAQQGSQGPQASVQTGPALGQMRSRLRDHLGNPQYSAEDRLDAVGIMLADCYSDYYERRINRDALLEHLAYIQRFADRRRLGIDNATGSIPVGLAQQGGAAPIDIGQRQGAIPVGAGQQASVPHQTIERILETHAQPSPFDEPAGTVSLNIGTTFPDLHINGEVVPSLQQARSDDDHTNFCGYFALHNAVGFFAQPAAARLNRADFIPFFRDCLQAIHESRGQGPYSNMSAQELRDIVDRHLGDAPIAVVEMAGLAAHVQFPELELGQALDDDQRAAELLQNFINGAIPALSIIAGLGDGFGHWIAIHAMRTPQGAVSIKVADSLHPVNFYNDPDMVAQRILPFYLALTTPVQHWPEVLAEPLAAAMQGQEDDPKDLPESPLPVQAQAGVAAGHPQAQVVAPDAPAAVRPRVVQPRPAKPLPIPGVARQQQGHAAVASVLAAPVVAAPAPVAPATVVGAPAPVLTAPAPLIASTGQASGQDQPVREVAQLRAQLQDLNQAVVQERHAHHDATQELERLRAENAELRKANPGRVDAAAVQAENAQLRQRARPLENQVAAANHGRQVALGQARQHATRIAQLQREHGDEVLALRRRIQELQRGLAQAPAQAAAGNQELQEQLDQAAQDLDEANGTLAALLDHYHLTDAQVDQIVDEWIQRQRALAARRSGQAPAAPANKK